MISGAISKTTTPQPTLARRIVAKNPRRLPPAASSSHSYYRCAYYEILIGKTHGSRPLKTKIFLINQVAMLFLFPSFGSIGLLGNLAVNMTKKMRVAGLIFEKL